jgi:beta-fructofuranosidase
MKDTIMTDDKTATPENADTRETPAWPDNPPAEWLTYHLAHPGPGTAWPGDPNPAFFWNGRYHLHYIYDDGGFVFGHLSSEDMVRWTWHPTVLGPHTVGHGMFSGTGFFTKEGRPAMIYHGQGSGKNWVQIATDDDLDSWSDPVATVPFDDADNPVEMNHWDPDCWLMDDTYYALSGGNGPKLIKSNDLETWEYLGDLLHDDYPDDLGIPRTEDISCANMFPIGDKWMLLCISHPLGCRYYLGDFKDEKFLPESHAMMNWEPGVGSVGFFFAPESLLTPDGRRVMWAWITGDHTQPSGIQSLPRELDLPADGVLRMRPLRELESLRYDEHREEAFTIPNHERHELADTTHDAMEMAFRFEAPKVHDLGVELLRRDDPTDWGMRGENSESWVRISVERETKTLRVGSIAAPFELADGEDLVLRVFVDKNLIEVFANDRQAVAYPHHKVGSLKNAQLYSRGGDVRVTSATWWKMKSIYTD